jgi:hypothetical protein
MTHPRQVIRETTAVLLRNAPKIGGRVRERVFCTRVTALESDTDFPCINVMTTSERTIEKPANYVFDQELDLVIEIYERRAPKYLNGYAGVEGLKNLPRETQPVDQFLDDICEEVEKLLFSAWWRKRLSYETDDGTVCLDIYEISDISTDFEFDPNGQVIHGCAKIKFTLKFRKALKTNDEFCDFENFTLDFRTRACDLEDPLDNESAIKSAVYDINNGV